MVNLELFVALRARGKWLVVRVVKQGSTWLCAQSLNTKVGVELN